MLEMQRMDERRYSVPSLAAPVHLQERPASRAGPQIELASEDLHAWSIYRQNLNSDFADSALGAGEKSPLPYGNFQLRESTVRSILRHPRYGPRSELGGNMYTYLKFGLPRVFPPGSRNTPGPGLRADGSSGYDSSDDGSPRAQTRSGYLRSRSEQHLNLAYYATNQRRPPTATSSRGGPNRSSSEANLLALSSGALTPSNRASSQQFLNSTMGQYDLRAPPPPKMQARRRRSSSGVFMPYPHLQLRGVGVENHKQTLLEHVSMEARGGDMLGIMATNELEATTLLEVLSGRRSPSRGEVWLNGHLLRASSLRRMVSLVGSDSDNFDPEMSCRQTLRLHSWLNAAPANSKVRRAEVEALLSELGLSQVRDTRVGALTSSEKVRLHVACALLQGCDILALDGPARNMDIFDTFFLLEFLRQWSVAAPRIVALALHPPTFEIFCMLSRVALVASGRMVFTGRRSDMLPYFARIEYPCPAFKNPSDYYLDLVTLDDLSAEAMLESSQRIQQLGEVFARKQPPLSDPGPPADLPPRASRANVFRQAAAICLRSVALHCPLGMVRFSRSLLLCAALSVCVGAVFWDLRGGASSPQHGLADWLSFHMVMMGLSIIPLAVWAAGPADRETKAVNRDVRDGLYSKPLYYICKLMLELPVLLCLGLAYLAPAYAMSGTSGTNTGQAFLTYFGVMLVYWLCAHSLLLLCLALIGSRLGGTLLASTLHWLVILASGFPLHHDDLSIAVSWLQWVSPARWLLAPLATPELSAVSTVTCKAVQVQRQDIIVQLPCAISRGPDVLRPLLLTSEEPWSDQLLIPLSVTALLAVILAFLAFFIWSLRPSSKSKKH